MPALPRHYVAVLVPSGRAQKHLIISLVISPLGLKFPHHIYVLQASTLCHFVPFQTGLVLQYPVLALPHYLYSWQLAAPFRPPWLSTPLITTPSVCSPRLVSSRSRRLIASWLLCIIQVGRLGSSRYYIVAPCFRHASIAKPNHMKLTLPRQEPR